MMVSLIRVHLTPSSERPPDAGKCVCGCEIRGSSRALTKSARSSFSSSRMRSFVGPAAKTIFAAGPKGRMWSLLGPMLSHKRPKGPMWRLLAAKAAPKAKPMIMIVV